MEKKKPSERNILKKEKNILKSIKKFFFPLKNLLKKKNNKKISISFIIQPLMN